MDAMITEVAFTSVCILEIINQRKCREKFNKKKEKKKVGDEIQ